MLLRKLAHQLAHRNVRLTILLSTVLLGAYTYASAAKSCNIKVPYCPGGGTWSCECYSDGSSVCTGGCN
jgi:hypothetical protein